jgi:hypothetical protein
LTIIIKIYFNSRLKDYEKKIDEKYKVKDCEFFLIIEIIKKNWIWFTLAGMTTIGLIAYPKYIKYYKSK